MSVTIDRLSIEIESNAQGAYQGIEKLAESLGKLKENGSFGTAVRNLKGLKEALDGLNIDNSTIRNIRRLSDEAASTANSLNGVNRAARNAGGGFRDAASGINTSTLNMSSFITVARAVVDTFRQTAQVMGSIINDASEWDGIVQRFARGFGDKAQETYEWIQRLNEEMGINIQKFMQYSSIYATMLTGFGVSSEDSTKMALGYTELTYDIWAGYNDIYKTFEEAADAVKSAIAGEVEPIRRAGFTIIESTLEQTAANHGLQISLEKATEAQKSYLRYLTLVDQAHTQNLVGTYAKEMNTAEGLMRTLSQQVKSLAQAFGSLFIPVLVKVVPWLQAFVDLLKDAIVAVGAFFGVDIQFADFSQLGAGAGAADDFADSANDAAKAAKDLKKATIGMDELNIISPPTASNGTAGGAGFSGLDVDSLWDESIFDTVQSQVKELKEKIKELLPIAAGVGLAIAGWSLAMKTTVDRAELLKKIMPVIGKVLGTVGISIAVGKLVWDFTGAYLEGVDKNALLKAIGTTVLGSALAGWLAGSAGAGIVLAVSGVVSLKRLWLELKEGSIALSDPESIATMVVGTLETVLGGALVVDALRGGKWVAAIGGAIKNGLLSGVFAGGTWLSIAKDVVIQFGSKLATALGGAGTVLASIPGWAIAIITAAVGTLIMGIVDYDFTSIGEKLGSAVAKVLRQPVLWINSAGEAIRNGMRAVGTWLKENVSWDSIFGFIKNLLSIEYWGEVILPRMGEIGANILMGLWNGIVSWWGNLKENIGEFIDGFLKGWEDELEISSPSKVFQRYGGYLIEGLWLGITGWFTTLIKNISTFVDNTVKEVKKFFGIENGTSSVFKTIGSNLVQGVIDGIMGMGSALWSSLSSWASGVISSIKGFFDIHSPSRLTRDEVGFNLVAGIVEGISNEENALVQPFRNMWANAENWWNRNAKLPTPSIPDINAQGSLMWAAEYGATSTYSSTAEGMTVEQMQQAVYEGVLAAMAGSQRGTNSAGNEFYVYLDGREITASVEKRQRERGVSIMGAEIRGFV